MIVFKSCPRCHGDLYVSRYDEICCLQCGYEPGPRVTTSVLAQRFPAPPRRPDKAA